MTNRIIKYIMAATLPVAFTTAAHAQFQIMKTQENIKVSGKLTDADVDGATIYEKETIYQYYDGFNRPVETTVANGTPLSKDLIQPVAYDAFGGVTTNLLPYTDNNTGGWFRGGAATTAQATFYNTSSTYLVARDNSPYSGSVFESSPLRRVLQAGMVGDGFQPGGTGTQHYKTVNYRSNNTTADGNIFVWAPNGTYTPGTLYGANSLWVTDGTDEDGVETRVYTDVAGRTVLKRQIHSGGNLDTYYVYNMAGMLTYIIPPAAVAQLAAHSYSLTASPINKMIFSYIYDNKGRLATKTVPSAGAVYYVYDYWNRPVLIQDGNLRANNKWNYIKYDVKGRAISQGIYVDATHTTQSTMQSYVDGFATNWYESRSATLTNGGYYTNNCFPTTGTTALAYAYFDNYDIDNNGTDNFSYATQSDANLPNEESATTASLRGVPTMVSKTTIGSGLTGTWLTTVTFFDKRGNPIQVQSNNQVYYVNSTTLTDIKTIVPDFTGVPQVSKVTKKSGASAITTVYTGLTYDHMYRITGVSQKYGTAVGGLTAVASYQYNELGQVIKKGLGYVSSGVWLQNLDMRFNIRGQLLTINNSTLTNDMTTNKTNGDTNDLFGMEMVYDKLDGGLVNTQRFNGKLTGVKWMSKNGSGTATKERGYIFTYDDLDRYTAETYGERATAGTGLFSTNANGFDEYGITYDVGGNITHLNRKSSTVGGGTVTVIDNMTYTYDTANLNQLKNVADVGTSAGFVGGTGNYVYDANSGNLTTDPYKGLTLTYNALNRTDKIQTSTTNRYIDYTYDANGNILRKRQYDNSGGVPVLQKTTDYIDGFLYENSTLVYFPMPEGRVLVSGSTYTQEFVITDQQGNARLSFQNNSGTAKAMQENSYYGFGMTMTSAMGLPTTPNKRLYNGGSEWQNDYNNSPDYYQTFYRNYDAALGRFIAVDPMAEATESLSVYHYAGNNPIMANDPGGDAMAYNTDPFSPGFNQQVGNVWTERGVDQGFTPNPKNPDGTMRTWGVPWAIEDILSNMNSSGGGIGAYIASATGGQTVYQQGGVGSTGQGRSYYYDDNGNFVKSLPNGSDSDTYQQDMLISSNIVDDGLGTQIDMQVREDVLIGERLDIYVGAPANQGGPVFKDASNDVDSRTLGGNIFWTNYTGPWNPKSNNGNWNYQVAPTNRADLGAMRHDLAYDKIGITGASGLFLDTRAIKADYTLVQYELSLSLNWFNGATSIERLEGGAIGLGIGLFALPKTIVYGIGQAAQSIPASEFPGL